MKCGFDLFKVTSESLLAVGRMERLEVLAMVGCSLVNDIGLHYLGKGCPSLQVSDFSMIMLKFY